MPPPTCAAPIESAAEFVPPPPIVIGLDAAVPPAPADEPAVTPPDCAARDERATLLPPPSCTAPFEAVASLPLPETPTGNDAATASPTMDAPSAGATSAEPVWATPFDPVDELPPPTCTAPFELDAVLLPLPPTVTGTLAVADPFDVPADADGDELTGLDCALPADPLAVLPPPACTDPTELVAVLSPVPVIDVGAETAALVPDWLVPADGDTDVFPTCTAPMEPLELLSASAVCAVPSVSATTVAATSKHLALMSPSFV